MTKSSGANTTNCGARLINSEKNITKLELILQTTLHSWLSMTRVWQLANFRPPITHHEWWILVWLHWATKSGWKCLLIGQLWKGFGALNQERQFNKTLVYVSSTSLTRPAPLHRIHVPKFYNDWNRYSWWFISCNMEHKMQFYSWKIH